jgi:excisionase family DNA binding protein
MTDQPTLIAVDPAALEAVTAELRALRAEVAALREPQDEWLTIQQAAARLECSADTIRRRIASGEIEARGSGKTRRVRLP